MRRGAANSYIATLIERRPRCVILVKRNGKTTETVVRALMTQEQTEPEGLMASLTRDPGLEMSGHRKFTLASDISVYFCDTQSPLLADCKGNRLPGTQHSQSQPGAVALSLNARVCLTMAESPDRL